MSKKIIIIGNNSGGMYGFRKELIGELISKGNNVTILTPFDKMVHELREIGVQMIETPIERRGINPITDFVLFLNYVKILRIKKPDLIITYTIKPNIYAGFASRILNIPLAANITGLGTAFQNSGLLRNFVTILYKISLKNAEIVFFENEENQQLFIKEGIINEKKSHLLMGAGVNLEYFQLKPYPTGDIIRFLFMGRVMKEKGINELFTAVRKMVKKGIKVELDVLGGYEEDYKNVIETYEAEGWLHYFGYQSDVRPFIEKCHCFVLPSWHEGMANTNLESAASGRPVITSKIHGCLEAVEDGVTGYLVEKKNVEDLYDKLKKFVDLSYEKRKYMGIAGRKRMENLFDKRKVVSETISNLKLEEKK